MKRFIILLGLAVSLTASAQDGVKETAPAVFTLQQAIDYALNNQKDVKNAILEERIAHQKVNEIAGAGLPQITSGLDVMHFFEFVPQVIYGGDVFGIPTGGGEQYFMFRMGVKNKLGLSVDVTQLLFSGEYLLGLKASKVYVELSARSTERTKIETTAAVTKAYYTVLINEERAKLLEANISRLKKTVDETKAFLDNGLVEKIDYDRLTVTYNNLLVEQEKVNRLLGLGIYLLKFQIGMDMKANLTLTDKLADVKLNISEIASADKFDYTKRVEYSLFETQLHLAKLDFKRNKVAYLPTAAAFGNYSQAYYRQKFDSSDKGTKGFSGSYMGAKITLPIFTGLQRNARYQQAKLKMQQAENNMDFIKQSIDLELSSSLVTLQNTTSSYNLQKKNIEIAEEVVRVSKIKYDQGVGSNLELVTAETALKEAQTNYYNALFDALVAKIDFDKANGNIK
jgi:outer membrane protein TolC